MLVGHNVRVRVGQTCHLDILPIYFATHLNVQMFMRTRAAAHFRKEDEGRGLRKSKRDGGRSGK